MYPPPSSDASYSEYRPYSQYPQPANLPPASCYRTAALTMSIIQLIFMSFTVLLTIVGAAKTSLSLGSIITQLLCLIGLGMMIMGVWGLVKRNARLIKAYIVFLIIHLVIFCLLTFGILLFLIWVASSSIDNFRMTKGIYGMTREEIAKSYWASDEYAASNKRYWLTVLGVIFAVLLTALAYLGAHLHCCIKTNKEIKQTTNDGPIGQSPYYGGQQPVMNGGHLNLHNACHPIPNGARAPPNTAQAPPSSSGRQLPMNGGHRVPFNADKPLPTAPSSSSGRQLPMNGGGHLNLNAAVQPTESSSSRTDKASQK